MTVARVCSHFLKSSSIFQEWTWWGKRFLFYCWM